MTHDERLLLNAKIGQLLYAALVSIRAATFPAIPGVPDRRVEVNDLADLLHNLPRYIVGLDEHAIDSSEQLREAVVDHVRRFHPGIKPELHRYVQLIDMDAETFFTQHKQHPWVVSESPAHA